MPLREPMSLRATDHGFIAKECTNKGRTLLFDLDMITEDYVTFETAKLLKEKGFDSKIQICYTPDGMFAIATGMNRHSNRSEDPACECICPTLQMAMKWLREVHKIEIRVIYDNERLSWYGACNPMNELSQILLGFGRKNKSYEEACEEAINYALENLI